MFQGLSFHSRRSSLHVIVARECEPHTSCITLKCTLRTHESKVHETVFLSRSSLSTHILAAIPHQPCIGLNLTLVTFVSLFASSTKSPNNVAFCIVRYVCMHVHPPSCRSLGVKIGRSASDNSEAPSHRIIANWI